MSSRIAATFATLKKQGRAGLIPFIMGGDPDLAATAALLPKLAESGADFIEIGLPFSDPMADGPVIQAAGLRALAAGTDVKKILQLVADFRKTNDGTPIILMGYYNPLYRYGADKFCTDAKKAGVDGLILVDLPPEEENEFRPACEKAGIALIRLIAPTSVPERLPLLLKHAQGFAYYISVTGITGAKSADEAQLAAKIAEIKKYAKIPLAVGFGVKTPEQARAIAKHADAVVVGSALVDALHREGGTGGLALVRRIADTLRQGEVPRTNALG